jgi:6-phosphogluconolactonase
MLESIMKPDWQVYPDRDALLRTAAQIIRQCEAESGSTFSIVLAGGQTPLELYTLLSREPMHWEKWHVYLGDERCLPPSHPGRNSFQIKRTLLTHVPIPAEQIFMPAAELGPVEAASRYSAVLAKTGEFDLVLLGLGEDGHTASLFPGRAMGQEQEAADVLPVFDAPKLPPERISLSARRLSRSRRVLFLVTGAGKREAVANWRQGKQIPASLISASQAVTVLSVEAACPREFIGQGDTT